MLLKCIVSALALANSVLAISFSSTPSAVVAGQTYTITWTTTGTGPVTILLREGDPNNLQTVGTITSSGTGGSYSWTAPSTFKPGNDYAFQISDDSGTNYSGLFSYTGGTAASSSAPASSASASISASASYSASASSSAYRSSATASISIPSGYKNSTSTLKTSTSAPPTTTSSPPSPTGAVQLPGSGASALSSPIALILGAVAAMLYLQ